MDACPRCSGPLSVTTCQACGVAWVGPPSVSLPPSATVLMLLPLGIPPLAIVCWPCLSFVLARRLYLKHAAPQEDLFQRILFGVLLSLFAGVGALAIVFCTCLGGVAFWISIARLVP
jgi:hypothetical protein